MERVKLRPIKYQNDSLPVSSRLGNEEEGFERPESTQQNRATTADSIYKSRKELTQSAKRLFGKSTSTFNQPSNEKLASGHGVKLSINDDQIVNLAALPNMKIIPDKYSKNVIIFDPMLGTRNKFNIRSEKSEQIKEINKKIRKLEKKLIMDFLKKKRMQEKNPIESYESFKDGFEFLTNVPNITNASFLEKMKYEPSDKIPEEFSESKITERRDATTETNQHKANLRRTQSAQQRFAMKSSYSLQVVGGPSVSENGKVPETQKEHLIRVLSRENTPAMPYHMPASLPVRKDAQSNIALSYLKDYRPIKYGDFDSVPKSMRKFIV